MTNIHHVNNPTYNSSKDYFQDEQQIHHNRESLLLKLLLVTGLTYLVWTDRISIVFGADQSPELENVVQPKRVSAAMFEAPAIQPQKQLPVASGVELPKNALNNLTFAIDPLYADRYKVEDIEVKNRLDKCELYIEKYSRIAQAEMKRTGIPASITLAQGLLESDAGQSRLALKTHNHFGIKCFSRACKKGHCANFTDDTHKDFFVRYTNPKDSFKAHSHFLKSTKRYANLWNLSPEDYRGWAKGLAKAGYATDKKYAEKLIAIIHSLKLYHYDRD